MNQMQNIAGATADKDILNDMLMTEKYVSGTYETAIMECANEAVRNALRQIQDEEQQHAKMIFDAMNQRCTPSIVSKLTEVTVSCTLTVLLSPSCHFPSLVQHAFKDDNSSTKDSSSVIQKLNTQRIIIRCVSNDVTSSPSGLLNK